MVFKTALISFYFSFLIGKVQNILTLGIPLLLDKVPGFRSTAENIIIVGEYTMIIITGIEPNAVSPFYKACLHGRFSLPIDL